MKHLICTVIFCASLGLLVGVAGGIEQEIISETEGIIRSLVLTASMFVSGKIGGLI